MTTAAARTPARVLLALAACVALLLVASGSAVASADLTGIPATSATAAAGEQWGYIDMADGVGLRYTVHLPEGEGPFPVLLQYSGYAAGTDPYDNGLAEFGQRMRDQGFAILGVSMRGTGCSEGEFDLFTPLWSTDGAAVVEWAAAQPWSNGRIGMVGASFPGISQLMVASQQPDGLEAIAPAVPITDLYRDVGYPGGIYNHSFANFFTAAQKTGYAAVPDETLAGDSRCAAAVPEHNQPDQIIALQGPQHPYADDELFERFLPAEDVAAIDVPTLWTSSWQDEQLGSRATAALDVLDRDHTWAVLGNGSHASGFYSDYYNDLMEPFFRHYLLGEDNGWDQTPRVHLMHEVDLGYEPGWVSTHEVWPPPTRDVTLHVQPDGTLGPRPATDTAAFSYRYPQPSPSVMTTACAACQVAVGPAGTVGPEPAITYKAPVPDGGAVSFTTVPFDRDTELLGPASADLWLSSTAATTDLQVTVTEVRPDGQELYVQRGWLRASHRTLDEDRSTPTRPFHTHAADDARPLVPGVVTPVRVEVWPFNHVFRAGSALRMYVEAPASVTGFRQLLLDPTPAQNTLHVGPDTPSRLVVSLRPGTTAPTPLPACDSLVNQPCRPNSAPPPDDQSDRAIAAAAVPHNVR